MRHTRNRAAVTLIRDPLMTDLTRIPTLHDEANLHWHDAQRKAPVPSTPFLEAVLAQHRANFELWHEEDKARDPKASDGQIARVKRSIDSLNQQRNDLAERIDERLLQLAGDQHVEATLHSESPGLIIDRLSILSLKLFHTAEQIQRPDTDEAHRRRNEERLSVLITQRDDLGHCLVELWCDLLAGRRRFKLYRQLKMYNDPTLNPVLYRGRENAS